MDDVETGELQISSETMNEIIQNIASPIEVAALINSLNIPFSTSYLADPENLSTSTTSFEMAYSLGALSADHSAPGRPRATACWRAICSTPSTMNRVDAHILRLPDRVQARALALGAGMTAAASGPGVAR